MGDATLSSLGRVFAAHRHAQTRAAAVAASVAACAFVQPALAQSQPLSIELAAQIPPRCGFASGGVSGAAGTPDLEAAGHLSIRVRLDCNTPYALGVVATNGALTNLDARPDGSGFAFAKPYSLQLALETDRGIIRSERCLSPQLRIGGDCSFMASAAGRGLGSGRGISVGRDAVLDIRWADQSTLPRRLAQGRYRDTLTLVIGPRA